jgi:hypothetical protein
VGRHRVHLREHQVPSVEGLPACRGCYGDTRSDVATVATLVRRSARPDVCRTIGRGGTADAQRCRSDLAVLAARPMSGRRHVEVPAGVVHLVDLPDGHCAFSTARSRCCRSPSAGARVRPQESARTAALSTRCQRTLDPRPPTSAHRRPRRPWLQDVTFLDTRWRRRPWASVRDRGHSCGRVGGGSVRCGWNGRPRAPTGARCCGRAPRPPGAQPDGHRGRCVQHAVAVGRPRVGRNRASCTDDPPFAEADCVRLSRLPCGRHGCVPPRARRGDGRRLPPR